MPLEQFFFTFFLHVIHNILDFFEWFNVNVIQKKKIFQKWFFHYQNISEDFDYLCSVKLIKTPNHIALAFLESSISIDDIAKLVIWGISSGSTCISLYDYHGFLKLHQIELQNRLTRLNKNLPQNLFKIKWYCNNRQIEKLNGNGSALNYTKIINICLLSKDDGKPDIVQAAQCLARKVADGTLIVENVNETVLASALSANRGLSDPELLLRFGMARSNVGFPPWQIRLTEIHDIDTHHGIILEDYFQKLKKYSDCEQRFGR